MITARGRVGIQVMAEICQKVIDELRMPSEWALSIVVPIIKGKVNIRNCSCYRAVKLLEHGMKVVKRVLENRLHRIVSVGEMQFCFMHERGTIYAVFILRRMQEEYHVKGKKFYLFHGPRESLLQSTKQGLEWAMRKKEIPEVFVSLVMSLYEGVKTGL